MTADELKKLAGRVFADLDRARITPRQALIMSRLVRATLVCGRQSVLIPRREYWARFKLTGGNVADALNGLPGVPGLVGLLMVFVKASPPSGERWTILPDATQWRCDWRFSREDDAAFLADLNAVANQVQAELLPAEKSLDEARAEVSAENAASKATSLKSKVPDLGTLREQCAIAPRTYIFPSLKDSKEFSSSKLSTAELLKGGESSAVTPEIEADFMQRCQVLFGEMAMKNWGGRWRNRVRANPRKMERVLAETARAAKAGEIERSAGGYANDLWGRFQ